MEARSASGVILVRLNKGTLKVIDYIFFDHFLFFVNPHWKCIFFRFSKPRHGLLC
jgi:hypothetical protein